MVATVEQAIGLPPKEAIAFLRQKTNQTTERWTDVWNEAHSRAFSVAGAASEALVQDFREAVAKAIETGTSLAEFRKDFDAIVAKHGWVHNGTAAWRSQIIYETNLSTAYSAGRYAQMTEPDVLEAFPYWRYQHNAAIHPRVQHVAWSGLVLRADDPWWRTHYPPNGWRCHCSVSPVSQGGLGRMGRTGPDTAPPIDLRRVNVRGRGEVEVPRGIDPGFGYNPGQAWLQHADRPVVGQLPGPAPAPRPTDALPKVERPPLRAEPVHVDPREIADGDEPVLVQRGEPQQLAPIPRPPGPEAAAPGRPAWLRERVTVAPDYRQWADQIIETRRPDGTRRVVGQLSNTVMSWLEARQEAPASRALSVTAAQVIHIARDSKAASGRGIGLDDLRRLPDLVRTPVAVLRERGSGAVLLVFNPSDPAEVRRGKLVLQLGMDVRARGFGGVARKLINGIKTAGLVPLEALRNGGTYELIEGSLQ